MKQHAAPAGSPVSNGSKALCLDFTAFRRAQYIFLGQAAPCLALITWANFLKDYIDLKYVNVY